MDSGSAAAQAAGASGSRTSITRPVSQVNDMIKKADILLGIVLVLLCLSSLFLLNLSDENGSIVTVSVDGRHYGSYDLTENRRIEIGRPPKDAESKDTAGNSKDTSLKDASANDASANDASLKEADEAEGHSHAYNIVEIRDGAVFMAESSCANQVCVQQGAVRRVNQTIVCLPNKVVVSISGPKSDMDSVSY